MAKIKFKKGTEPLFTTDPYYDLLAGGYYTELIESTNKAKELNAAIQLINDFMEQAEGQGFLEIG